MRALKKAGPLNPEIRLAQAISEFEADLSTGQKHTFSSYRLSASKAPLTSQVVDRLTGELDLRMTGNRLGGGRCLGPRFTNILHSIQQFASIGDVMIGGSQNLIACGVWSVARFTLLSVITWSSFFEKLSMLLMSAGCSAPRYERMVLLYPQSQALQSYLSEYFLVVVQICHRAFKFVQKRVLGQIVAALGDEEVNILSVEEHRSRFKTLILSSESEATRRRNNARISILQACSTYDYQTTWKQIRKRGNASLIYGNENYLAWKANEQSCTLICTGKLGSGKSVLLANVVDDLNRDVQSPTCPVAYFFCRYDLAESLTSDTIIRSLVRQLLQPIKDPTPLNHILFETGIFLDRFDISKVFPPHFRACVIVDGLDACEATESEALLQQLQHLQDLLPLRACLSFRADVNSIQHLVYQRLKVQSVISIPEQNPDIEGFIMAELERRIESRHLAIGNPGIVAEIQDALLCGAQGMFLWVALQIDALCSAATDESIRQALVELPGDLPEMFNRILKKSAGLGEKYQTRVLELLTTARRPLTTEECREALSVVVGDADWKPSRQLNNVYSALASCGSLITVDEEDDTVSFIHHSVVQYLFNGFSSCFDMPFTKENAENAMGCVIVTYLNYGVFDNQVSRNTVTQVDGAAVPSRAVRSMNLQTNARSIALRLLRSKGQSKFKLGEALQEVEQNFQSYSVNQFAFFQYAKSHWSHHARHIAKEDPQCHALVLGLLRGNVVNADTATKDSNRTSFMFWAAENGHTDIVGALINGGVPLECTDSDSQTPLLLAAKGGHLLTAELLVMEGANLDARDFHGRSILSWAIHNQQKAITRCLLGGGADVEAKDDHNQSVLAWAVRGGDVQVVELLVEHGVDLESKNDEGRTALSIAAELDLESIVDLLVLSGADLDSQDIDNGTPLFWAAKHGNHGVIRLLVGKGAQLDFKDDSGQTTLQRAVRNKLTITVKHFVHHGADMESKDNIGQSALSIASGIGSRDATDFFILQGADCESRDIRGQTLLLWAARNGHAETVLLLLVYGGADIESKDENGQTALIAAAESGHEDTVKALVDMHARLEAESIHRRSALSYAASNGHMALIRILLAGSARMGSEEYLLRPLLYAVGSRHLEAAKMLIEAGADPAMTDIMGTSALSLASQNGNQNLIPFFIELHRHNRRRLKIANTVAEPSTRPERIRVPHPQPLKSNPSIPPQIVKEEFDFGEDVACVKSKHRPITHTAAV